MGAQMDRLMGLARYQVCRMKDLSDKFHLLNEEPECVNVCFWYIPKRFRGMELNKEVQAELGKVRFLAGSCTEGSWAALSN